MGSTRYIVLAGVITPGHMQGEILPGEAFGDLLDWHLESGAIQEYAEPEPEPETEPPAEPEPEEDGKKGK